MVSNGKKMYDWNNKKQCIFCSIGLTNFSRGIQLITTVLIDCSCRVRSFGIRMWRELIGSSQKLVANKMLYLQHYSISGFERRNVAGDSVCKRIHQSVSWSVDYRLLWISNTYASVRYTKLFHSFRNMGVDNTWH
jgi:hypothetical protein